MHAQPIIHVEFAAADPAATARFYAEVFGWQVRHDNAQGASQFQAAGGPGGAFVCPGGMADAATQGQPGTVLLYLDTDDIEAALAAVERHGGATLTPRTAIPGVGWYAVFADPAGTRMALFSGQPATEVCEADLFGNELGAIEDSTTGAKVCAEVG